jgi:molybdenum-dependent DNA-binding transcriptional regulator ModE
MSESSKETLRRKRLWTVADFAAWMGISPKQARAMLKRLDQEVGGMLLIKSGGRKPEYTFFPAVLAKSKPELFERFESLEGRVADIETKIDSLEYRQGVIASQTSQNSRDISRIKSTLRAHA